MTDRIIEWSASHKYLVLALALIGAALATRALREIPVDALPELSDTQVIIQSRWERSPDVVEDQLTYPIVTALLGAPHVKTVRGVSDYGYSYVYVIFDDGTDPYWARSRVLEYLSKIQTRLPVDAQTELGPDASGVGWVYQYALVDESGQSSPEALRSLQDWFLRYALQSVPGVAEVASVGGHVKQYQVTISPARLASLGLSLSDVSDALRRANSEAGGRVVELAGREYMVRGRGYLKGTDDIARVVVKTNGNGTPLRVGDLGEVSVGPEPRRGATDLDGRGDVVGGVVVMRSGENAERVITAVKEKLRALAPSLPPGVEVVTTYDRSDLIERAIDTLRDKLVEEILIVSLVILVFLWHLPSAMVPVLTIPLSVLLAFLVMRGLSPFLGLSANLMSLGGIAISIGVLVDGAIVEVENAYKKLHAWQAAGRPGDFHAVRLAALKEVGPSVFFSLLVIAVAFLPIFALGDEEGRLFKPLAYTKTLIMAVAAVLALTVDPALRMCFSRMDPLRFRPRWLARLATSVLVGTYHAEERHPVSRVLSRVYGPACRLVLRHPRKTLAAALLLAATTVPAWMRLGSEFMPPLDEGSILYMPTTLPGVSIAQAERLLRAQDRLLAGFPEVLRVFGKAGRAETATDPAPLSMMETTVLLKPESAWRTKPRWYSSWVAKRPFGWLARPLRALWPEHLSHEELVAEMDRALAIPGTTNAWTMPIKNRVDMLATGIRTPVGIKVLGSDVRELERLGAELESILKQVPGTRSVYAERTAEGYYLDYDLDRDALARYGLSVDDANQAIAAAVGGERATTTIEGRERYGVEVRYPRELRDDLGRLGRVLVPIGGGAMVPIAELATLRTTTGPSMLRDENGLLASYVMVDLDTTAHDIGGYVSAAQRAVAAQLTLPPGYALTWSGQFENMQRVEERMRTVVPVTLLAIFLLLYANTRSATHALVVLLAVPFSLIGAAWLLYLLGYHLSVAVWVGMIALLGLDAETGVFMLLYLDLAHDEARRAGRLRTLAELREAIVHGAVGRVRPKAMTVAAAFLGLLPMMWSRGAGADLMKRIAAPMVGGLATSFLLELLVYPAIYFLWKGRGLPREQATETAEAKAV